MQVMQVSRSHSLEGGRGHHLIGRIKACAIWRAVGTVGEADRREALQALILEAQDYGADAIIDLDFEIDGVRCADIGEAPLQRVAATGIAVRFALAAA
jgi:uncharacterized protein YbjQ (UPF0145 family)